MLEKRQPWVSVKTVAKHLGVSRDSVYRWVESKGMPAHRIGRLVKFSLDEVDAWVRGGGTDLVSGPQGGPSLGGSNSMVGVKKGWTSVSNPTRAALLQRFGEVVASLESMRASALVESVQGQIQDVLSDLQNLRSKLQTMPEQKLAVVASLDHLGVCPSNTP